MVAGERDDVFDRKSDVGNAADGGADDAEDHVDPETLANDRCAESAFAIVVGEIDIAAIHETCPFFFGEERSSELLRFIGGERFVVFPNGAQLTKASPRWRISRGKVNVGATIFLSEAEVLIDMIEDGVSG